MGKTGEHRYHRMVDPERDDSLAKIARLVTPGSKVLDLGTGNGALGQYLSSERNCSVDGIEFSGERAKRAAPHYRKLHVADLESVKLKPLLSEDYYDYIVCADILEHLRDPGRLLDQLSSLLAQDGSILLSVPNVAHMGLVADLLAGEFQYRSEGLLDETHLRFFTRKSLLELLSSHGLTPIKLDRVLDLENSEYRSRHLQAFPPRIKSYLRALPESLTYQFIVEVVPNSGRHSEREGLTDRAIRTDPFMPELRYSVELFWREEHSDFDESRSSLVFADMGVERQEIEIEIPALPGALGGLRLDPSDRPGLMRLYSISLYDPQGGAVWVWDGKASILEGAGNPYQIVFADRNDGIEGIAVLLAGDDPRFELPVPEKRLGRLSQGGVCKISVSWPESADYLALVQRFPDLQRYQDLLAANRVVTCERDLIAVQRQQLWDSHATLNQELGSYKAKTEAQVHSLREQENRIGQMQDALEAGERRLSAQEEELVRHRGFQDEVYGSFGWRVLTRYWNARDRFLVPGARRRELYDWIVTVLRTRRIKLRRPLAVSARPNELEDAQSRSRFGRRAVAPEVVVKRSHPIMKKIAVGEWPIPLEEVSVSVVIPTKNAGERFRHIASAIRNQKGFRDLEIVVVDSGSTDGTLEVAKRIGAKIIEILPEEFSHAYARNLGADHSSGDCLLFTVQDALPPSNSWLHELFSAMKINDVIAVSCAEFPASDADLFYRAISWNHYRFLEVDGQDRIMSRPVEEDHSSLRKNGQLSDLACLIRRDDFLRYRYETDYAEDLDLGLRLIRDGHKIAFLSSTRVIHSHNRAPYYYLRRGYVDNLFLPRMFPDIPLVSVSPDVLFPDILFTLGAVQSIVHERLERIVYPCSVEELSVRVTESFEQALKNGSSRYFRLDEDSIVDPEFISFLDRVANGTYSGEHKDGAYDGKLIDAVLSFTQMMLAYMLETYERVDAHIRDDFKSSLYKLYAYQCGAQLAHCFLQAEGDERARLEAINSELIRGV